MCYILAINLKGFSMIDYEQIARDADLYELEVWDFQDHMILAEENGEDLRAALSSYIESRWIDADEVEMDRPDMFADYLERLESRLETALGI